MTDTAQSMLLLFNLAIAALAALGGFVLRDLASSIKDLRAADQALARQISAMSSDTASRQDLKDIRAEMNVHFTHIAAKLDTLVAENARIRAEMARTVTGEDCDRRRGEIYREIRRPHDNGGTA